MAPTRALSRRQQAPSGHTSGIAKDLHTWSLYASAVLLLCLTPAPSSLLAVTNDLRFGVGKTLFSTLGCAVALTLLIGTSLSEFGLILAASETVFYIIKWLGACYLIYLVITLVRTRGAFTDVRKASRSATPPSEIYLFAQGLWIVVMNPKAVIFFAAFLPQFYVPQHGLLPQFLMMAGTFVGSKSLLKSCSPLFASKLAAGAPRRRRGWCARARGPASASAKSPSATGSRAGNCRRGAASPARASSRWRHRPGRWVSSRSRSRRSPRWRWTARRVRWGRLCSSRER